MKTYILFAAIALCLFSMQACREGNAYERQERKELASGERYDSLFLGLYLGMPSRGFFDHCFDLNRKHLVKQGLGGAAVEYILPDMDPEIVVNFYPEFYEDKICQMPARFSHRAWAPWNRKSWADSLQQRLIPMFKEWYGGNDFIRLDNNMYGPVYAKVDGNRRILMTCEDDHFVRVTFTDMIALKKAEADKVRRQ